MMVCFVCESYRDVIHVLAHLLGGGHHVSLRDPVLQVLHLSAQQEVVVGVIQLPAAVLRQLPQPGVLLIHPALTPDDAIAAEEVGGRGWRGWRSMRRREDGGNEKEGYRNWIEVYPR